MSGVGGIGGNRYNYGQYQAQRDQDKHTRNISSGKKLNQASDGAAEMAIAKKLAVASKGYEVGRQNLQAGRSALNIADGGLGGITDYLQRMRELSIRANNGLMGESDRQAIQDEVSQLQQGVDESASKSQYNELPLLTEDGSVTLLQDGEGQTMEVTTSAVDSASLGLGGVNALTNFDLDAIDAAMERVSTAQGTVGAESNRIDYASAYNGIAAENMTSAQSVLEDADIAEDVMEMSRSRALTAAQLMMQKQQQEQAHSRVAGIIA